MNSNAPPAASSGNPPARRTTISGRQLDALLGYSRQYRYALAGKFPDSFPKPFYVVTGGRPRFWLDDVEHFCDLLQQAQPAPDPVELTRKFRRLNALSQQSKRETKIGKQRS